MDHPSTFYRLQQEEQVDSQNSDNRQRGVLGFDVLASTSTSALSSTMPRRRSGSSNVNVNKWNDPTTTLFGGDGIDSHSLHWEQANNPFPTPLSLSSSRGGPTSSSFFFPPQTSTAAASSAVTEGTRPSRTNQQTVPYDEEGSARTRDGTMEDNVLPAWFPDVPSKAQIETLKVTELMEACTHRGLKKVIILLLARSLFACQCGFPFVLLQVDAYLTQFCPLPRHTTLPIYDNFSNPVTRRLETRLSCNNVYGIGRWNAKKSIKHDLRKIAIGRLVVEGTLLLLSGIVVVIRRQLRLPLLVRRVLWRPIP
jgi:hypothetical protein